MYNSPVFSDFKRITDSTLQKKGVDVIVSSSLHNLANVKIDEKCSSHYVNKNIPTFAFEIGSFQNETWREGWLFNAEYQTEYYLVMWPNASLRESEKDKQAPYFDSNEITSIDYYLISRQTIWQLLLSCGFERNRLILAEQYYRKNNLVNHSEGSDDLKRKFLDKKYGFYFTLTPPPQNDNEGLSEEPFNVVILRNKLKEIAIIKGSC